MRRKAIFTRKNAGTSIYNCVLNLRSAWAKYGALLLILIGSALIRTTLVAQTKAPENPATASNARTALSRPVPLDNTWMALYTTLSRTLSVVAVEGSNNRDPGGKYPIRTDIDTNLGSNPKLKRSLTYASGAITVQFFSDAMSQGYCCYVWRPYGGAWAAKKAYKGPESYTSFPMRMGGSLSLTVRLTASPGTVFEWAEDTGFKPDGSPENSCAAPAFVRPMLSFGQAHFGYFFYAFDTGTDEPGDNSGRWFAKGDTNAIRLSDVHGNAMAGTTTVTVPLSPDQWTGVLGQSGYNRDGSVNANFAAAVANPWNVSVAIGGGCFYGHGIRTIRGSASLSILSYSYTPPQ
jgi:hypothetical protein